MYLKSLHPGNFRHGLENCKILKVELYKPSGLEARECYKVLYESDNTIDYIPVKAVFSGEWEIFY